VGHEHILLVDDEPQLLAMQEQILERLGYAVTAMRHSKDALAMFRLALNDALDQSETHPVAQGVVLQ
jgi:CheY-like chemotaxis protein